MARPPSPLGALTVAVLCVALVPTAIVPVASAEDRGDTLTDPCTDDYYDPEPLDSDWERTFTDPIANGSLSNWDGGRLVSVGSDGGCSLVVLDGDSARLNATTINGTRGVVTGTLDLGANGTLTLSEASPNAAGEPGTADENGSAAAISNRGPDFSPTLAVEVGNQSRNVTLSTGRFFGFGIVRDNASTRATLWDAADPSDEEELTFANTAIEGRLTLRLDGRAFLDGISVGVLEPDRQPDSNSNSEYSPQERDDSDPFERHSPSSTDSPDYTGELDNGVATGLFLLVFGMPVYVAARPLARFSEQMDAIGSTTSLSEVEPARWKVMLTRLVAVGMVAAGVAQIVGALL